MRQYSLSLILKNEVSMEDADRFIKYVKGLSVNERQLILVSKIVEATGIEFEKVTRIMLTGCRVGVFYKRNIICCPECGYFIEEIKENEDTIGKSIRCYSCDENITIGESDIITAFSVNNASFPFEHGQNQLTKIEFPIFIESAQNCDSKNAIDKIANCMYWFVNDLKQKDEIAAIAEKREIKVKKIRTLVNLIYIIIVAIVCGFMVFCLDIEKHGNLMQLVMYMMPIIVKESCDAIVELVFDKII